eukprot:1130234_1
MGMCHGQTADQRRNAIVDQELDHDQRNTTPKLLLLGPGGSGKSTIFKQLKGIYGKGFNQQERQLFMHHIYEQVTSQMVHALIVLEEYNCGTGDLHDMIVDNQRMYVDDLGHLGVGAGQNTPSASADNNEREISYSMSTLAPRLSEDALEAQRVLSKSHCSPNALSDELVSALKCLWAEPSIQKMYKMRNITNIYDSSAYFWNKLDLLNSPNYVPDEADILLLRHRTTGATEQRYTVPHSNGETSFSIVDVGGQISERRKWIRWFDAVTAVIFVASLSCYDEVLFEDYSVNSMVDQLELFDKICNHDAFSETGFILFLNKKDLFKDKIKDRALTICPSFSE